MSFHSELFTDGVLASPETRHNLTPDDLMAAVETLERLAHDKCIIEDCASRWLAQLDSDVGRLVYVSMLGDASSARYCHAALEDLYSPPAIHQALLCCQEALIERALGHSLEQLERDLRMYFAGIDAPPGEIAARWLEPDFFQFLLPLGVPFHLRNLFLSLMAVVLKRIVGGRVNRRTAASPSSLVPAKYLSASIKPPCHRKLIAQ